MLFDINILSIATILQANPTLLEVISFNNLVTFLELSKLLKPVIASWKAANATLPPKKLPEKVSEFFKEVLGQILSTATSKWIPKCNKKPSYRLVLVFFPIFFEDGFFWSAGKGSIIG